MLFAGGRRHGGAAAGVQVGSGAAGVLARGRGKLCGATVAVASGVTLSTALPPEFVAVKVPAWAGRAEKTEEKQAARLTQVISRRTNDVA